MYMHIYGLWMAKLHRYGSEKGSMWPATADSNLDVGFFGHAHHMSK